MTNTSATPTFTAPAVGAGGETLMFQLVVSDGTAESAPDQVSITVRALDQPPSCEREPVDGVGDGDTSPDAVRQGAVALVRAERSGLGTGRVYQLTFRAQDDDGATCTGHVSVCVPHDRGCGRRHDHRADCADEGQVHDSLSPPRP